MVIQNTLQKIRQTKIKRNIFKNTIKKQCQITKKKSKTCPSVSGQVQLNSLDLKDPFCRYAAGSRLRRKHTHDSAF